ncbi:HAD family hydrolase [Streptomyces boninensis]|uniref:HAD family hydrolase n=1 Tax=Streptomyces boninensis TaxID=2039455 RepID=UPI003B2206A0
MLGLPADVRACLFDLDGVLTRTMEAHLAAWRAVFDDVLAEHGRPDPFTDADYQAYVDGKPRFDGVRDFLTSRGIELPAGTPADPPAAETIAGVGNRKNARLLGHLRTHGVAVYEGSVRYVRAVRAAGYATAVVTASANRAEVLKAAGIADLFDTHVDGIVRAERGLAGKPAPDTFLAAAADLGFKPDACAVFEDALAGVAAGRAGDFGHVIGVDRLGQRDELLRSGADVVVDDLAELLKEAA